MTTIDAVSPVPASGLDAVLWLRGVTKEYPTTPPVRALRGVDFAVTQGELVGVVGPSGSGKSSVVAAGLIPALRGGAIEGSEDWYISSLWLIGTFQSSSPPIQSVGVVIFATSLNGEILSHASAFSQGLAPLM